MNYKTIIGVDISKKTIDVALKQHNNPTIPHCQFSNNQKGFTTMMNWIGKQTTAEKQDILFCMEHTGVYVLPLACYLSENKLCFCLENPYHIKHSMGLQRGKTDKADAKMIARYATMHQEELKLSNFPGKIIIKLQALLAYRERLVNAQKGFKVANGELSAFVEKQISSHINKETKSLIKCFENRIKKADKQIDELIKQDLQMSKNYELAKSVKGIGPIIASYMIVYTQNFTTITDSRKFASFSGIEPFEHSSGTSIKKRNSVSHLGNKKMKRLLNNGAWNAAKYDNEIKIYFKRKLEEGKNQLSIINAVRNKIVSRVFAVVKRGTPFVNIVNYT
jgi:transposase